MGAPEQTSQRAVRAWEILEGMKHARLANRNELPMARSTATAEQDQMNPARSAGKNAVRNKTAAKKTTPVGPLQIKTGSKSKSERLLCRYCGSADLAPSFIERRDRRCRKCFSKRYGSAARAKNAKVKKKWRSRRGMRGRARKGSVPFALS
jgi:hypothetical protein